jgi:type III restriction enzyme
VKVTLKDYQAVAVGQVLMGLRKATADYEQDGEHSALSLSAPTGAGKTVIAAAVIERLFEGDDDHAGDPNATVLWLTDDPSLNEQTRRKMLVAASKLKPSQLVTIDSGFDASTLPVRVVHFLNIQKLGRTTSYVRGGTDLRQFSLWTTLRNTIEERGGHFYVVIDEAHRGAKADQNRQTIVSRVISDADGSMPASPIVWGISATPERFQKAMNRASTPTRIRRDISVPIDEVRDSGLLKDKILVKHPTGKRPGDSTLIRLAVRDLATYERYWAEYAQSEDEPAVEPVFVVQVPPRFKDTALRELLATVRDAWPDLGEKAIAHTFESHASIALKGEVVRYIKPEDIQDDPQVRVVLFKEALTTGWDCPRAEVMLSLRKATDYTYIAQLVGRMVRTPLARRVATNDVLNTVALFLPHFDEAHVDSVIQQFREDPDAPPTTLEKESVECTRSKQVPVEVFDVLQGVPSYVVPGRTHRSQIARVHALAALLSGDAIDERAISNADKHLVGTLDRERARLSDDGELDGVVSGLASLDYQEKIIDLLGSGESVKAMQVGADSRNIHDLLVGAGRYLRDGLAKTYWARLVEGGEQSDIAKLVTAALAADAPTVTAVESAAAELVRVWMKERSRAIGELAEAKRVKYYDIRAEARESEVVDLALPAIITASGQDPRWKQHLYADSAGVFPARFTTWEQRVLEAELNPDSDLVAWYRNPTGGDRALRVPYKYGDYEKPMYPDFVFFHKGSERTLPSIVDPHNYALADAGPKWRGLAIYAAHHGDLFGRIDAVICDETDTLMRLDLKDPSVREGLDGINEKEQILSLFSAYGAPY